MWSAGLSLFASSRPGAVADVMTQIITLEGQVLGAPSDESLPGPSYTCPPGSGINIFSGYAGGIVDQFCFSCEQGCAVHRDYWTGFRL